MHIRMKEMICFINDIFALLRLDFQQQDPEYKSDLSPPVPYIPGLELVQGDELMIFRGAHQKLLRFNELISLTIQHRKEDPDLS